MLNPLKYRAELSLERLPQELTPQAAGGWVLKNSNYFGRVGSYSSDPQTHVSILWVRIVGSRTPGSVSVVSAAGERPSLPCSSRISAPGTDWFL